MDISGDEMRQ